MIKKFMHLLEITFIQSWWVILFALFCYILFEQGAKVRQRDYAKLTEQLDNLEKQKLEAKVLQEDLLLQINSQSDPAWIELVLMKGLGVVPEGQTKYFFKTTNNQP
jgi:hypothetical protein